MRDSARVATVLMMGLLAAGCASTGDEPGFQPQWDGLVLRPGTRLDAVYVHPEADVRAYTSVLLDPVQISFAKEWNPNHGSVARSDRLSSDDVTRIRAGIAELFQEVFREELEAGGYAVVDSPGYDTLGISPAIVDLYINAPERSSPGRVTTYTAEAGRMTLVIELRDSVTGDILARAIDSTASRQTGMLMMSSQMTNEAEARRAFKSWAGILRDGLDEARAQAR